MAQLTPAQHQKSATLPPSKGHPRGRFPMPDREHAKLALEMLPRAKGMGSSQKADVRARAEGILNRRRAAAAKAIG